MTGGVTSSSTASLGPLARVGTFLEMIKISHTVFALPFAVGAAFLAEGGLPSALTLTKIVIAVLFARTAAMTFNRIADRRIDAGNPRTKDRALPAGLLSLRFAVIALVISIAGFLLTAWWINDLALRLAPVALTVVLGYSLTKRFTSLCHVVLGLGLAIAPLGAWVAIRGELASAPWFLALSVLLWTCGFDILYACMDEKFDREQGLHSIPTRLGIPGALRLASLLHIIMIASLYAFSVRHELGVVFLIALAAVTLLLIYEHAIVKPDDLGRVNRAFFTTNGIISFLLMSSMIVEAIR